MKIKGLWVVALVLLAGGAHAGDMYKWVDSSGRVNIGDTVPAEYKQTAIKIAQPPPPDAAQQAESKKRADADRRRAAEAETQRRQEAKGGAAAAAPNPADGAAAGAPSGTDCASLRAAYAAAQACYAPYVTKNGLRGGATDCPNLPDPSSQCGSAATTPQ